MSGAARWLFVGALAGVALAAGSLLRGDASNEAAGRSDPDAVAIVNGAPIARETLARFTATLARERGRLELDPAERRRILARLIDEELLLQRGLALDLARREPAARRAIVAAVIDALTTDASREPTREELERFVREDPEAFRRPGRVSIEAVRVPLDLPSAAEAPARAAEVARRAKAGESLAAIAAELAEPIEPPLPAGPISIDALRDRVGGLVLQALAPLAPGETSEPVRAMDGYWIVRLVAREPDTTAPLEEIWESVRQAWTQREHDAQLEAVLAELRAQAQLEILDPELAP